MGVTVSDLLKLPCLRKAKVVAGQRGVTRLVSSVSVLEYADPEIMEDSFFHNDECFGSEIVITGFMNNPNDEELQCATILKLAKAGEVGMILYYVGVFMPAVTKRMIEIADEMDFVLIVMPEQRMDARYSEAICEIMELVVKDRMTNTAFVSELLEQVSRLPNHQRTVATVLQLLSVRIMASLFITDQSFVIINEAAWPQNRNTLREYLTDGLPPKVSGNPIILHKDVDYYSYRYQLNAGANRTMELIVIKEGQELPSIVLDQVVEVVGLAVNIWSTRHDEVAVTELVRSILQDEPMKMRRLASIFHIDVAAIHCMMIVHYEGGVEVKSASNLIKKLTELLKLYNSTVVADIYEGEVVVFLDGANTLSEEKEIMEGVHELLTQQPDRCCITCCNHLADTTQVREAFLLHQSYLEDARKIFVTKDTFHLQDIEFARECRQLIAKGESALKEYRNPAVLIRQHKEEEIEFRTLEVFLLDADCSYQRTAELLFVHKNTVKYRIGVCSDRLGYKIPTMPETLSLYYSTAIERLLRA